MQWKKLKLLINLDIKLSTDIVRSRREFHSLIVPEKKENVKISFFVLGTTILKALLPRAHFPFFGFR